MSAMESGGVSVASSVRSAAPRHLLCCEGGRGASRAAFSRKGRSDFDFPLASPPSLRVINQSITCGGLRHSMVVTRSDADTSQCRRCSSNAYELCLRQRVALFPLLTSSVPPKSLSVSRSLGRSRSCPDPRGPPRSPPPQESCVRQNCRRRRRWRLPARVAVARGEALSPPSATHPRRAQSPHSRHSELAADSPLSLVERRSSRPPVAVPSSLASAATTYEGRDHSPLALPFASPRHPSTAE